MRPLLPLLFLIPLAGPLVAQRDDAAGAGKPGANAQPQGPATSARVAPQGPDAAGQQGGVAFAQEVGPNIIITIDETSEGIDLEWLTKLAERYTGIVFTYDEPTAQALRQTKVRLLGTKVVPKADLYAFYQILMFINQYILTKVGPDPLAVVLVQPVQGQPNRQGIRNEALYINPEDLDKYADQVATQVITVLHLPHTDVRQLGNSLRAFSSDPTGTQGVVPVGSTNSVILSGFASNVASMARILKIVDRESARDTSIAPSFEVLPLEFAAAEDVTDVLQQLLEARTRATQATRAANPQGVSAPITGQTGETKVITDRRTNSLLVMALPDDMLAIKELVARLDVEVIEPERTYHVYALENVKAEDLAETLSEFIEGASRVTTGGAGGNAGAAARPAGQAGANVAPGGTSRDNEIIVVPDEATNSLLVAASKRRYEEVVDLIQRLDRRQDQVLIETALIELSGINNFDLGVELGFANLPNGDRGGFGLTNFGLGTFSDTDGDGIPDTKIPNTALGVTAGILDGDDFALPVLLAALKNRQDTNVLNIPSVLVNNNGSATIKSVDSQPTTQITATGGVSGQTQENFQGYQDAGITMTISPSISASGYLRLDISLEVSTFQGTFQGAIPPPKITRTIQTTVNVPNGDTMVVGGIITDNKSETRTGVPFLADIPVLGMLFRRQTDNKNRTTLYFFVTPHILRDKNFADLAEITYKVKLDAADKIGADRIRLIDPSFGRKSGEVDLQGFDVPLHRSPRAGEVSPEDVGLDPMKRAEMLGTPPAETPPQAVPPSEPQTPPTTPPPEDPRR